MNNIVSQTEGSLPSALRNNFTADTNVPLLHANGESESASIKFESALSEQRRSDDVWLGNFPNHPQESNCSRNDENCNGVKHSSSELSNSDKTNLQSVRFNHQPVKRKLTDLNFEKNVKDLHDSDFSFKVGDVNPYTKKPCLSDDKESSLESPIINEEDKSKVGASHSTTPKIKCREFAVMLSTNADVNSDVVRQGSKRSYNYENVCTTTECLVNNKTVSSNNGMMEENIGNIINRNFAIPVQEPGIYSEHLSPSTVTSAIGILPVSAVHKTPTKSKQSEDSPKHKLWSSPLTPRRRANFSALFKRRFGTPQSNRIDKYCVNKEMEHLDVSNSKSCVKENSFEFDGHIPSHPDVSSLCPQENVTKSETSHKKCEEDVVILYDKIGSSSRNAGSSDTANSMVVAEKRHCYNRCKEDINIIDVEFEEDGISIDSMQAVVSVAGVGKDTIANASSRNYIDLNEVIDHVEGKELESEQTLQPHVIGSENLVDNMKDFVTIELSSSDDDDGSIIVISDEHEIEICNEESHGVRSLEVSGSQDVEFVENTKFTAIDSDQNHTKMPHRSKTHVFDTKSSAQENMYFTHTREAVLDCPGAQSVSASNCDEPKMNCPASNPVIVSSPASEPETVSSLDSELVIVNDCTSNPAVVISPASKPETVNSSSDPSVLRSCDYSKSLVVNNFNGNSECINSKSVIDSIPNRKSGGVCCAKKNSIITSSSGKQLLSSSISGREVVVDNTQSSSGCCKKPEDADGLAEEPLSVDTPDRGQMVNDRPVTEPMGFNECGRKIVIVDKPESEPVIVRVLDKEPLVTGKLDRKLVVPGNNEEDSLDERTITASCGIGGTHNIGNFDSNNEDTSQAIIKINVPSYKGSGHCTSARERGFGEKVSCDQLMMSYKAVMYKNHDSAARRMGLKWVPVCCLNPYSCTQHHKRALYKPFEVCAAKSVVMNFQMYLRQWSDAFDFCCSATSERNFPSASSVLRILDFILNTHNDDLIGCAVLVFKKIVDLHPPCAPDMLKYYTSILTNPLGEGTPNRSSNGIVLDIICRLNDMISLKDLQSEDSSCYSSDIHEDTLVTLSTPSNIVDDCLHCEEYADISADERAEDDKNYRTLKHDEKLNRLFLVLEIIVELFEVDMSVFLVKRSFHLRKALSHHSYKPLIVSVLWKTSTVQGIGQLNSICGCIIGLYAKCFVHKIRFNQRNVVARLLNLVAEAVWASECNNELIYPYFGERCKTLTRDVSHCMSGINPEDMVEALTDMMPSFLALCVTNSLLSNAGGYETTPSLKACVELLQKCFFPSEERAGKMNPEMPSTTKCKLIGKKRNINKRNPKGETALHLVCKRNKVDELRVLLKDPDIDVNAADNFGWTALHEAVHSGGVDCVRELLEYKPPPGRNRTNMHVQSGDGTSPLIDAVQSNQLESCKLLLKYGGSSLLKDKNHKGMNALDAATSPAIKALLESVRTEDDEIIEGETTYCPLVPLLLPVMLHSYMDTYQTLHIMNSVKSCMRHDHTKTVHSERKGRPKLKFEYERFLKDYRSYRKLKGVIRSERENSPNNEMIRKLLFLL